MHFQFVFKSMNSGLLRVLHDLNEFRWWVSDKRSKIKQERNEEKRNEASCKRIWITTYVQMLCASCSTHTSHFIVRVVTFQCYYSFQIREMFWYITYMWSGLKHSTSKSYHELFEQFTKQSVLVHLNFNFKCLPSNTLNVFLYLLKSRNKVANKCVYMRIQMKWLDDKDSSIKSIDCLQFNVPWAIFSQYFVIEAGNRISFSWNMYKCIKCWNQCNYFS